MKPVSQSATGFFYGATGFFHFVPDFSFNVFLIFIL